MDPLQDGKSRIELLWYHGGDLEVVNDAKATFDKVVDELTDKEEKLIHYLVRHIHTSPFRGTVFKFRVKAPLFVCRQWWKHVVASSHIDDQIGWNELSLRYTEISDPDEFYIPQQFRKQSKNNKQATDGYLNDADSNIAYGLAKKQCRDSYYTYKSMLDVGVGREQARAYLVPAIYTTWVWTTSLQAVLHFIGLRKGEGAQHEITLYANAVYELIKDCIPVTIREWESTKFQCF